MPSLATFGLYGAMAIALAGGVFGVIRMHDNGVRAADAAAASAVTLATTIADNARTVAALTRRATDAEALFASQATIKKAIANAPQSTACMRSGPVHAAIAGMRRSANGG